MEAFPVKFCRGLRIYWRRRKYQKLKGSDKTKQVIRCGKTRNPVRRFKLRSVFRIRIRAFSPVRIISRIRDAYVDAMLLGVAAKGSGLSGSRGPELLMGRRIPKARPVRSKLDDFERRLIMEIYNSVMSSKEFSAYNNNNNNNNNDNN